MSSEASLRRCVNFVLDTKNFSWSINCILSTNQAPAYLLAFDLRTPFVPLLFCLSAGVDFSIDQGF